MPEHPQDLKIARELTSQTLRALGSNDRTSVRKDDIIQLGKLLWEFAYQHEPKLTEIQFLEKLRDYSLNHPVQGQGLALVFNSICLLPDQQITGLASSRWFDQGLPTIQMGHKYAAALMATNPGKSDLEELRAPWKAFVIDIPGRLLTIYDPSAERRVEARFLLVHQFEKSDGGSVWSYICFTETAMTMWKHGSKISDLLTWKHDDPWAEYSFVSQVDDEDERVNELIARLIINVCLAATDKTEKLKKVGKAHNTYAKASRNNRPPVQRVFQLGKPIKLDCRQAVKDYVEGRTGHVVSVQSLVMGHWKRQAHGPQRSLRKRLWIEPYWRGPEDAPIVQRPHDMGKEK